MNCLYVPSIDNARTHRSLESERHPKLLEAIGHTSMRPLIYKLIVTSHFFSLRLESDQLSLATD